MSLLLLSLFFGCGERGLLSSCGLLIAVASFVEYGCQGMWFSVAAGPGLQGTDSLVAAQGLSYFMACGIFQDQGSNLCLLHWQADSLP